MKKYNIFLLIFIVLLCLSSCTSKNNNIEITGTNEVTESTQRQETELVTDNETTSEQQETSVEPFVFDLPEDFLECEQLVGAKLSELGTSAEGIQYSGVMTEIGRSSLFEKSGAVYISLGWDKDTITEVYIIFGENIMHRSFLLPDEYNAFCSRLESLYGERTTRENGTDKFSGNGDYKCILMNDGSAITWNDELSEQFLNSNPNPKHPRETEPEPAKQSPAIGMTADEVRNSTWGSPSKINTTITQNGTVEQWCYPGNRYIYLTDGIVTGIQK